MDLPPPRRKLALKRIILVLVIGWAVYGVIHPLAPIIREVETARLKESIKSEVSTNAAAPQVVAWMRRHKFDFVEMYNDEGRRPIMWGDKTPIPSVFNGTIEGSKSTASGLGDDFCIIVSTFYLDKKGRLVNSNMDSTCQPW